MPNHVHIITAHDGQRALAHTMGSFVQWRNHHRGESGQGIEVVPAAERITDKQKLRRSVRYVHLNPCRARLCDDPLGWPWSTHRDRVGLALLPVVGRYSQPARFHRYVSSDPTVDVQGSDLPTASLRTPSPLDVRDVISALARVPVKSLSTRGPWRLAYLRAARTLCDATASEVGSLVGVRRERVRADANTALRRAVLACIDDPRFPALQ